MGEREPGGGERGELRLDLARELRRARRGRATPTRSGARSRPAASRNAPPAVTSRGMSPGGAAGRPCASTRCRPDRERGRARARARPPPRRRGAGHHQARAGEDAVAMRAHDRARSPRARRRSRRRSRRAGARSREAVDRGSGPRQAEVAAPSPPARRAARRSPPGRRAAGGCPRRRAAVAEPGGEDRRRRRRRRARAGGPGSAAKRSRTTPRRREQVGGGGDARLERQPAAEHGVELRGVARDGRQQDDEVLPRDDPGERAAAGGAGPRAARGRAARAPPPRSALGTGERVALARRAARGRRLVARRRGRRGQRVDLPPIGRLRRPARRTAPCRRPPAREARGSTSGDGARLARAGAEAEDARRGPPARARPPRRSRNGPT